MDNTTTTSSIGTVTKSRQRILIIDDDLYIRELYQEILSDEGYSVTTAVNGEEGLVQLQEGGYNLTLLDVMMPKLDGIGVLKKLQEKPPRIPNGPILLITNLGHGPMITEGLNFGATAYYIKADLTPDQLVTKLRKYL